MKELLLELKEKYEEEKNTLEGKSILFSRVRVILFFLFVGLIFLYSSYPFIWLIVLLAIIVLSFLVAVLYHNHIDSEIKTYDVYLEMIEQYEIRTTNEWQSLKEELVTVEDSSLLDLGIFGKNSLFQFLNFTSSLGGRNQLVDTLSLKTVEESTILENQKSIEELKNNLEGLLIFQEKLKSIKNISKIDFKEYFYLFDKKEKSKKIETIISFLFSGITIVMLILSLLQIVSPAYFVGLFLFQLAAAYFYQMIYREEFDAISNCSRTFGSLKKVYQYMDSISFSSKKNLKLQSAIRKGKDTILKLDKISNLNAYRFNFVTNIIGNVFFSLNFLILYRYGNLLNNKSDFLKKSIYALEEFEVLISLATIGIVKEQISFPTIQKDISLDVKEMRHPLLEENVCIPNSFQCKQDIQIITGSNMSGKTSFMKTIGVNLVLSYTGTYVTAEKFSCSIMKIFTSINVKDDISNGISTFYGELQRIKNVLDFSKNEKTPMVVFIDEIFKGTNYNDRILGAKEVLKKLSKLPCIVFLTTHDFELCEINDKKIHNYHFEETYHKNKISFDYKIKNGQCKTTNAKYLMKEIGIID